MVRQTDHWEIAELTGREPGKTLLEPSLQMVTTPAHLLMTYVKRSVLGIFAALRSWVGSLLLFFLKVACHL